MQVAAEEFWYPSDKRMESLAKWLMGRLEVPRAPTALSGLYECLHFHVDNMRIPLLLVQGKELVVTRDFGE